MAKTITHKDLKSYFGEKDHLEVSKSNTFTQTIFELLTEREPTNEEVKLFDLILNLCIDHGPESPSGIETVKAAKIGKTISESLSNGILQINESHGGAGEPLMEILYKVKSSEVSVEDVIEDYLQEGKRLPGFGHRIYKQEDLRAELVMDTAVKLGVGNEFVSIVKDLKNELKSQSGKDLVINIDGAIAAIFCGFGLNPKLGIAVFLIARTPGLIGQFLNNQKNV